MWAWGYGRSGNLGDGDNANSAVPVKVSSITVPVTAVVPGEYSSPTSRVFGGADTVVARGSDGSLWSWGEVGFGSNGGGGLRAVPGRIPRLPPVTRVFGTWFGAVY